MLVYQIAFGNVKVSVRLATLLDGNQYKVITEINGNIKTISYDYNRTRAIRLANDLLESHCEVTEVQCQPVPAETDKDEITSMMMEIDYDYRINA